MGGLTERVCLDELAAVLQSGERLSSQPADEAVKDGFAHAPVPFALADTPVMETVAGWQIEPAKKFTA
jgi:hypothetical protein